MIKSAACSQSVKSLPPSIRQQKPVNGQLAFSATAYAVALTCTLGSIGTTLMSTIRCPAAPCTLRSGPTTPPLDLGGKAPRTALVDKGQRHLALNIANQRRITLRYFLTQPKLDSPMYLHCGSSEHLTYIPYVREVYIEIGRVHRKSVVEDQLLGRVRLIKSDSTPA